jgi:DNA-binding Lrp family transcriptional regulator
MLIGDVDREIIELFSENVAAFYSINQIAKRLGKKYPYVNKRVSSLLQQGVLRKSVLGNTYLCSVNLACDSAVALLSMVEIGKRDEAAAKSEALRKLVDGTKGGKRGPDLICAMVCGKRLISVSSASQDKRTLLSLRGLVSVGVDKETFLKMLRSEGVVRDHIILYGFERYFEMVCEVGEELRFQQIREIA